MKLKLARAVALYGALLIGGIAAGILATEVTLRVNGVSYPVFAASDHSRGHKLRAGASGWQSDEGLSYVKINSMGMHDVEHEIPKPPATFRIAVLGDSYTEALQIPIENNYCSVLQQKIAACPALQGKKPEIINFGVGGYGTAQELITLQEEVWKYSPDFVLLAFTTGNDVADNLRILKQDPNVPYFVLRDQELVLDTSFRSAPGYRFRSSPAGQLLIWLIEHSRVLQIVNHARFLWRQSALLKERQTILGTVGNDSAVYKEPRSPEWVNAWKVTERLMKEVASEVKNHGAQFAVITLSNPLQVNPDPQARATRQAQLGVEDLFYPDQRIKALGVESEFPVINLASRLQMYAEKNRINLHRFEGSSMEGHWNLEAHRLVGEMTADELCKLLKFG